MVRSMMNKGKGILQREGLQAGGGACFGRDFLRHRGSSSIALGLDTQSMEKALL